MSIPHVRGQSPIGDLVMDNNGNRVYKWEGKSTYQLCAAVQQRTTHVPVPNSIPNPQQPAQKFLIKLPVPYMPPIPKQQFPGGRCFSIRTDGRADIGSRLGPRQLPIWGFRTQFYDRHG